MNQQAQQISATTSQRAQQTTQQISATSEPDLPHNQPGSEDEDETWLMEPTGSEAVSPINAAAEACNQLEEYWKTISLFCQHLRTQFVAASEDSVSI